MNALNLRLMESTPFSEILQQFLSKNQRQKDFQEHRAVAVFQEIIPTAFRSYIRDVSCKNGVLFVQITNASMKFDLMTKRTNLQQKINEKLGQNVVQDILLK